MNKREEVTRRETAYFLRDYPSWSATANAKLWRKVEDKKITQKQFDYIMMRWGRGGATEEDIIDVFGKDIVK